MVLYRPVPGYVDLYASMGGTIVLAGHGELTQRSHNGYPYVCIPAPCGGTTTVRVYRLMAAAYLGEQRSGMNVRHADDVKSNSYLGNLCYGSSKDNAQDAIANGKHGSLIHKRKTHCPKKHEYTPENTYTPPGTDWRQCRICRGTAARKRYGELRGRYHIDEDKQATIDYLLTTSSLSDRAIAKRVGVSHPTIARYRRKDTANAGH